ncbi:MAG: c-type cytochrome [Desulfosalsimonadaceae bacterium]|nr:c-type cytochrome [Desulfosalsimonadaceae bacterium]
MVRKSHRLFMFIGSLTLAAVIAVSIIPDPLSADQAETKTRVPGLAEKGSVLYEKYCFLCHGPNGEGYLADDANALSNQDFLVSASDDYIIQGILQGRPGTPMSAWAKEKGGPLTPEEAGAIVSFIRTWQKEPSIDLGHAAVTGNAENGAPLYERWCAACHGKQGSGGNAPELNNPVFQKTASDAYIRYAILNGRRRSAMSPYKDTLNHQETDDVVSFIRTLKIQDGPPSALTMDNEEYSDVMLEKGVLNPGNPPADFSLIENKYVLADHVYAAYKAAQTFMIIDARPKSDYLPSHIKGALSIPFYDIESAIGLLPKDIWIITYCVCPHALSGKAADKLRAAGYNKVAVLDEGFLFWQKKGYPSESSLISEINKWLYPF